MKVAGEVDNQEQTAQSSFFPQPKAPLVSDDQDEPIDRKRRSENAGQDDQGGTLEDSRLKDSARPEAPASPPADKPESQAGDRQGLINTKKEGVKGETVFLEGGTPSDLEQNYTLLQRNEAGTPIRERGREAGSDLPNNVPGFEIVDEIGRGAFGVVYRAIDTKLDRQVAIKLPLLNDRRLTTKYVQEAKNAAKLDTFGIVPVFQVGTTATGQPFVVQKLIEGVALDRLLREHRTLTAGDAVTIIYRVAKAIAVAHQAGLVHRDLKPANVLIDHNGNPWVADFGLAVFEEDQSDLKGQVAGTPAYMAPEQLGNRADWLDGRADIWAIGVMLYELLTGKPPFSGKSFADLKEQIVKRQPRPLSQRVPGIPTELDQIFNRCCAKQVDDRYASASLLAQDLEKLTIDGSLRLQLDAAGLGGGASRSGSILKNSRFSQSQLGRSTVIGTRDPNASLRWIAAAVAFIALACTIGFVAVWSRLSRPDPNEVASQSEVVPLVTIPDSSAQLRVAKTGAGTHTSIAAAIAAAQPGDEIRIAAGTYRESLVPTRNISLVGEGAREDVRIIGVDSPAVTVTGAQVSLTNLTLDADGKDLNTIEVKAGSLICKGSLIQARTFDCIKLHPGSNASLSGCDFISGDHPAIVAKQATGLELENCDFEFEIPNIDIAREQPVVAIELTECGGVFSGCSFSGIDRLGKAISARDSQAKIVVSNCRFGGLLHAVELFRCADIELVGGNLISGCELAVYSETCSGLLENLEITGCDYGLIALKSSNLTITSSQFNANRRVGVWIEGSTVAMEQAVISENDTAGILLDSNQDSTSQFRGCQVTKNQIGLLLVSGRAEFELGSISLNESAGVAVVNYDQLPEALRLRPRPDANQRSFYAKRVSINGKLKAPAVLFNAPGTYELISCTFVDVPNANKPALAEGLTTIQEGTLVRVLPR